MVFAHEPVLLHEVIEWLDCRPGGVYLDCTLGGGGHAAAILDQIRPDGRLIGIDQDPEALEAAKKKLAPFGDRVSLIRGNFRQLKLLLSQRGLTAVDGVLFDLGVSSPQLERRERGFSYQQDAPLDMRMDPGGEMSAFQLVNRLSEEDLAKIIWEYGEERWAKRIARFIIEARKDQPLATTGELVEVIKAAIPAKARRDGPHPAKRTFQALRIAVNDELGALEQGLKDGVEVLGEGGRICVISFHSLEDRIVKRTFRELARTCICPPEYPTCICRQRPVLKVLTKRPVTPDKRETAGNPRARSAKLRAAERLARVLKPERGE